MEIKESDYSDGRLQYFIKPQINQTTSTGIITLMRNSEAASDYYDENDRLYSIRIGGDIETRGIYLTEAQIEELFLAFAHMRAEYETKSIIPLNLETE